jgi:hypothetical protein
VQRCLNLHPGILDADTGNPKRALCWRNIDHSVENLVPPMPCLYANDYQPIEIPY